MTDAERIAVRLDLEPAADPIRGLLTPSGGDGQEFVGWLGLASAIEQLLTAAAPAQPPATRPPGPAPPLAAGDGETQN